MLRRHRYAMVSIFTDKTFESSSHSYDSERDIQSGLISQHSSQMLNPVQRQIRDHQSVGIISLRPFNLLFVRIALYPLLTSITPRKKPPVSPARRRRSDRSYRTRAIPP
uniref:Uncharacterized protein n=1 Tax=Steinernema glaseri TaxID=37863 RepID=A0A1I7ZAY4_9BILA